MPILSLSQKRAVDEFSRAAKGESTTFYQGIQNAVAKALKQGREATAKEMLSEIKSLTLSK